MSKSKPTLEATVEALLKAVTHERPNCLAQWLRDIRMHLDVLADEHRPDHFKKYPDAAAKVDDLVEVARAYVPAYPEPIQTAAYVLLASIRSMLQPVARDEARVLSACLGDAGVEHRRYQQIIDGWLKKHDFELDAVVERAEAHDLKRGGPPDPPAALCGLTNVSSQELAERARAIDIQKPKVGKFGVGNKQQGATQRVQNAILADPGREWTVKALMDETGASKSTVLNCMTYRTWRNGRAKSGRVLRGSKSAGGEIEACSE